ncbi:MAG: O-antigen ligase family protein, partial [Bdellovibrionales bacterium]|nr:O-antigen ligase family protein [Bdellovibrionales bacterium]
FIVRLTVLSLCGLVVAATAHTFLDTWVLSSEHRLEFVGLFGNSNDLAALFIVGFPFVVAPLVRIRLSNIVKAPWHLLIPFVVITLGIWLTQSRGAFLAIFCMGLAWFAMQRRASKLSALPILLVPVLLSLFVFRSAGDMDGSSTSRWNYVVAGFNMLRSSPVFGVGVGRYAELYELFTPEFVEWGKRTAHSSWVLIMSEGGLPGLMLFVGIFLSGAREAIRVRSVAPEYLLCLVGYGVSMSLLSHTYIFLPFLVVGIVGAAARHHRARFTLTEDVGKGLFGLFPRIARRAALVSMILLCFAAPLSAQLRGISDLDKPFGATHRELGNAVEVAGSRGEVLNFFVQLPQGKACHKLSLAFQRTSGEIEKGIATTFYFLPYVTTEHPSFPGAPVGKHLDPTVPIGANSICLHEQSPSWILAEVKIDRSVSPQAVTGAVLFGESSLPVKLTIWKMIMPERPSYPFYTEMTTYWNLLGHYGKWSDGEASLSEKYLKSLREHRVETLTTRIANPEVLELDGVLTLDIENRPTREQSFYSVNMKGRPDWAYLGIPTVPREEVGSDESIRYLRAVENSPRLLQHPGGAVFYLWDEPQAQEDAKFRQLLADAATYAPTAKVLVTTPYKRSLDSLIDIFVPIAEEIGGRFPTAEQYQPLRARGKEFWWYVSCVSHGCNALADTGSPDLVLDRPSVYIRSIGWLGAILKTDAFLYYHVNQAYQYFPERDPWQSLWDFSGNGDGTLFYPGRPGMYGLTSHEPVATLRLKSMRQSSYDAQYIHWMEESRAKPIWWETEKSKLVRSFVSWDHDFWSYASLRKRVAEYLNNQR